MTSFISRKTKAHIVGLLFLCSSLLAQLPPTAPSHQLDSVLKVSEGDVAPDFELKDVMGKSVILSAFRNSKFVVLAFYVFAFTPGCGEELLDLQKRVSGPDVQIIGISMDSMFSNTEFASKIGVFYPLLSDKRGAVTRRYGLFNPSVYGRVAHFSQPHKHSGCPISRALYEKWGLSSALTFSYRLTSTECERSQPDTRPPMV